MVIHGLLQIESGLKGGSGGAGFIITKIRFND